MLRAVSDCILATRDQQDAGGDFPSGCRVPYAMLRFRYHNTNCFLLRSSRSQALLAIDAGWPCTLFEYARMMKAVGCNFEDIRWAMVTHFHMDHAGLVGEFLDRGITCLVFENQLTTIGFMEKTIAKNCRDYRAIAQGKLTHLRTAEAEAFFAGIGVAAQATVTDYHSPDSVTLITSDGKAFIGDLPPQGQMMPDDDRFLSTWRTIWACGGRQAFPSHASDFKIVEPA